MKHLAVLLAGHDDVFSDFPIIPRTVVHVYELVTIERRLVEKQGRLEQLVIEMGAIHMSHLNILSGMKPERKVWPSDKLLNGKVELKSKGHRRPPERRRL